MNLEKMNLVSLNTEELVSIDEEKKFHLLIGKNGKKEGKNF